MESAYNHIKRIARATEPTMSYNGTDFLSWRKEARAKLSDILGLDRMQAVDPDVQVEYERAIPGAAEIRFTFAAEEGYRVACHLCLPAGVERPPVMICLQGHTSGMHLSLGRPYSEEDVNRLQSDDAMSGDYDFCLRAVKEGFAAVAMELRSRGESDVEKLGCYESAMTALLVGRTLIGERVWDVMRLIDVLQDEFADRIDASTVCCLGHSGGGTATAYTAALEDRLKLVVSSGAMCAFSESIAAKRHCSCNYVPRVANYFEMSDLMAMACPKFFVQACGVLDHGFFIAGSDRVFADGHRAYEDNGVEGRSVYIRHEYGHRFLADKIWPVVHELLGR